MAREAGAPDGLSVSIIERFLRTADETWDGAGSGQFTPAQFQNNEAYRRAAKNALRALFHMLANLLPVEAQLAPCVDPAAIRSRVEPMVRGLVQKDWQEVALRELVSRTFVLNLRGAKAALEVELPSCDMESAWRILWALYGDYGLRPDDIVMTCDGLAGDYAHVRWSAYEAKDLYSDVVVHEVAHLLHYLKPRNFGLHIRRGQERFVDIDSITVSYSRMPTRLIPASFSTARAKRESHLPKRCSRAPSHSHGARWLKWPRLSWMPPALGMAGG